MNWIINLPVEWNVKPNFRRLYAFDGEGIINRMEATVRYAKATDGTSIAFWTIGTGEPLVYLAGSPWCHVELLQIPQCLLWYQLLAENRMLVRYDVRGTGLSDREVIDHTLDAQLLDLDAVIDFLGLERFCLLGAANAGAVAVAYAARHPEKVSRLVLWCAWARGLDILSPRIAAWRGLLDHDWQLMTDTCAHLALGWAEGEVGRIAAENLRESITPGVFRAALEAVENVDVSSLLAGITAPTLVLGRPGISWIPGEAAKGLASGIPGARLAILDGESTAPYLGDMETAGTTITRFLNEDHEAATPTRSPGPRAELDRQPDREPQPAPPDGLTDREIQVLRLLAGGRTNNEVAAELVLSIRTVERHIGNIYAKIGARGRADATVYALSRGLI